MARKVVKVYLPPQQKRVLQHMCISLGMAESEALRTAFLEYAKSLGFVTEKMHLVTSDLGPVQ
jgi:hypothetical protein